MGSTLSDDSEALAALESLKETIEEWKEARKEEILKEVVYLKSLDVSIESLTEEASTTALEEAIASVEALSGYVLS